MSDEKEMTWALCPKCGELMGWPVGEPVDSCCDVCQSNIEIMSYKSAFIDARVRIDKLEAKLAVYRAALEPFAYLGAQFVRPEDGSDYDVPVSVWHLIRAAEVIGGEL
jgi:hypothetical protein